MDVASDHLDQALTAFVTATGGVIGPLHPKFEFGICLGRWRGEFHWPVNRGSITIVSSLGGLVTALVEGR